MDTFDNAQYISFTPSDESLKDNLVVIPDALSKVGLMTGYTYTWKEPAFNFAEKYTSIGDADTGIIAQDVDKLGLPGISTTRNDGVKVVRYERIVPILIEAIKELKTEITSLKSRVTTLEGS